MKALLEKIRKILRSRRTRQILTRFVSGVAAVVVFVTTYALVLPAITLEQNASCGIPEHQHTDACYEERLVCEIPEGQDHHHGESCYEKFLICGNDPNHHTNHPDKFDVRAMTEAEKNTDQIPQGVWMKAPATSFPAASGNQSSFLALTHGLHLLAQGSFGYIGTSTVYK